MSRFVKPITSDHDLIELYKQLNVRLDGILALPEIMAHYRRQGRGLSLTKDQLHGSGATLTVHPETAMKVQKAKRTNRGVRLLITPHEIEYPMVALSGGGMHGASIWSKVWGAIKSGFKYAKDTGVLSKLADAAVAPASAYTVHPGAVMTARQGLKSLTGIGIEEEGGRLSLADVKTAGSKALVYAKRKGLITDAVDLVEKKIIEKAERPEHVDLIKQVRKGV
ncbi:unnamed protein product [Phytophthora fragariaefolia]|uniref:Unnamed protein product n=1 Tax=Phytophthora fragariaefolia TaxID=1490495 RepID=A0A9W6UBB8_9STRA|nr:unnamed protein product [Phytophthora fragariaefolia]